LYEHLQKFLKANGAKKVSVGIITPHKLQLKCLQQEFKDVMNTEEGEDTYINTVDDAFKARSVTSLLCHVSVLQTMVWVLLLIYAV